MSIPLSELGDNRPTLAGDWHDDDAQVLNEHIQSDAVPPRPEDLPDVPLPKVESKPEPIDRMLTGTLVIQPGWGPQQLLPADPHRKSLDIRCTSAVATEVLALADDAGKLQNRSSAYEILNGTTWGNTFTGPVFVATFAADGTPATGTVTVSFSAVTE